MAHRCLAILHAIASVTPGGAAAAGVLQTPLPAALVGALGSGQHRGSSSGGNIDAWAASLLLQMSAEPGGAQQLAAEGAGPALARAAEAAGSSEARRMAAEALQRLQQQQGWRHMLLQPPVAQQATSSGSHLSARPSQPQQMSRASSAPSHIPAVQQEHQGPPAGVQRHSSDEPRWERAAHSSHAKVQWWQEQQKRQQTQALLQQQQWPAAEQPYSSGGGGVSVAFLVAQLGSPIPRHQLTAAEQLAAAAASGARAAEAITAAGGAQALLRCVRDNSGSPIDAQGSGQGFQEPALASSICTAALRALVQLVRHDPAAAATLPFGAASGLRVLLAGSDPQQSQLAAALLAGMLEAAGAAAGLLAEQLAPTVDPAAMGPLAASSDLLQTDQASFLTSVPSCRPSLGDTPATVLHRQGSLDSGGSGRPGPAHGGARRQLSGQLGGKPPLPPGHGMGLLPGQGAALPWRRESAGSPATHVASPSAGTSSAGTSDVFGSERGAELSGLQSAGHTGSSDSRSVGARQWQGDEAAAAGRLEQGGGGGPNSGPMIRRADITIVQVSIGACQPACPAWVAQLLQAALLALSAAPCFHPPGCTRQRVAAG